METMNGKFHSHLLSVPALAKRLCSLILGGVLLSGCQGQDNLPSLMETKAIAEEGLIYGLPIVMNYTVMYGFAVDHDSSQFKAPFNQLKSEARVATYEDTTVVTPNSDTPYSFAWLDLRAEPMVLSVPAIPAERYYSVQLVDASTFNYGYIGSRATGNEAGDYLVVGPDWQGVTPPGIKQVFRSGSQLSLALYRTQLFNPADIANVEKVQTGYQAQPLSSYLHQPAPAAAPAIDFPKVDKELAKKNFFDYLDFSLQYIPATADDQALRTRLGRIGVGPDKAFAFHDLPWTYKLAVLWGMKNGSDKIDQAVAQIGKNINGWKVGSLAGSSAFYNGNWLQRATVAKAGIYANDAAEAMYPITKTLADGQALDGSQHNYSITFKAGELPPVNAFWSITMYDGTTQLLIENPINRYLINSPMLPNMQKNSDGSLTLYIQKDSPGADKQANWLPAPNGQIYLVMRLYWPKVEQPSILPAGSGSWQPPALVVAE